MKTFFVETPLGRVLWDETINAVGDLMWTARVPGVMAAPTITSAGPSPKHLITAQVEARSREIGGRRMTFVDGRVMDIATNDRIDYSDSFGDTFGIDAVRASALTRATAKLYALWCDLTWIDLPVKEFSNA